MNKDIIIKWVCKKCGYIQDGSQHISGSISCPKCKGIQEFAFKCAKCGYLVYGEKDKEAIYKRICPKCHPEMYPKKISKAELIKSKNVTTLADEPKRNEPDYSYELWLQWYNKLNNNDHEILRQRGDDPFDPYR